jgi:four helix bundle protein
MNPEIFKKRTKNLTLGIIRLVETLPATKTANIIGKQVVRSATSVGANYRASCRAKSIADMINKLKIVEEEADETLYWLELLAESELVKAEKLTELIRETNEILSMTFASIRTLRNRK